jgi:hypothetical protein
MNSIMEIVCGVCNKVRQNTLQGLSFQKLLNHIRREFKLQDIGLRVRSVRDKHLSEEVFYVNGFYDPVDDSESDCSIELIITHNFPKANVWYGNQATDLLIQIFDTVVHELRHQRQYRKRHFLAGVEHEKSHIEYLADPDEIDAYSISIATELCRNLGKNRALRYLSNPIALSRLKVSGRFASPCLGMYVGAFEDPETVVLKQLAKKVYVRLQKIDTDCVFM